MSDKKIIKSTDSSLIKPLTLKIDKETWKEFKLGTPRSFKSINDAVCSLIIKEIEKRKKEVKS